MQTSKVREQIKQIREKYAQNPNDQARSENDIANLNWARKQFGPDKVHARNGMWLVKGMQTTLYHYQLFGAGWMINREQGHDGIYGGNVEKKDPTFPLASVPNRGRCEGLDWGKVAPRGFVNVC
jgi:hypothetical protein